MTPKKKARQAIKAKIRDIIRHGGSTPTVKLIAKLNAAVAGWVNYFGSATPVAPSVRSATIWR
ncbi:group II intron maturase-specific domain-containing protein [Paraburkholderia mimosarum]|uniref:group II intron maturase-specific domain-containing protein n=1 Tax=Paraburkholderia mimosarum TaxID=312026 RepID=UPI0020D1484E|nr:group II intron maturase-specific domain-containing protein [Paraburkholderia mimosarum]